MREANKTWMARIYDSGFIPEADRSDRAGETPIYDYMRSGNVPLKKIMEAAELASLGDSKNIGQFLESLKDDDSAIRYWGATGLMILKEEAKSAIPDLKQAAFDPSGDVAAVAAEALYNLGEKKIAVEALLNILKNSNQFARTHALNVIDCINEKSPEIIEGVVHLIKSQPKDSEQNYDMRAARWLIKKWELKL